MLKGTGQDATSLNVCWNWRDQRLEALQSLTNRSKESADSAQRPNYFGASPLDALACALWATFHTTSSTAAIAKCVNLLGDADSTACVAGQLAGAFYGASNA